MTRILVSLGLLSLLTVGCAGPMVDDNGNEIIIDEVQSPESLAAIAGSERRTPVTVAAGAERRTSAALAGGGAAVAGSDPRAQLIEPSIEVRGAEAVGVDSPRAQLVEPSIDVRGADAVDPMAERSVVVTDPIADRMGGRVEDENLDPRRGSPRGAADLSDDTDPRHGIRR